MMIAAADSHSPVSTSPQVPIPWVKVLRGDQESTSISTPDSLVAPPIPIPSVKQEVVEKDESNSSLGNRVDSCDGNVEVSHKSAWKLPGEADSKAVIVDGPNWPALSKHNASVRSKPSKLGFDPSSLSSPNSQLQGQGLIKHGAESSTGGSSVAVDSESNQQPHKGKNGQRVGREGSSSYKGNHSSETRPIGGGGVGSHRTNSSSRRGNGGPRPRGGGSNGEGVYNQNHRHDHRNNWNGSRGSNLHLRPPPPPPPLPPHRGFIGPPLPLPPPIPRPASPFIPMRPFRNPMGLDMAPGPFFYGPPLGPIPLDAHPPPMFLPPPMPLPLATSLLNQIDFYFSEANLLTDEYLKKNMDAEGWVPISLIASFRRVQNMTGNIELILNSLRPSNVVEVQGDKVRRRNDWMRWVRSSSSSDHPISPSSSKLENETKVTTAAVPDKSLKEEESVLESA